MEETLRIKLISEKNVDIEKDEQGIFFSSQTYIITREEEDLLIVYQWFGNDHTKEDREISEEYVKTLSEKNKVIKSIIYEAREPSHFIALFHGIVIFKGSRVEPSNRKERQTLLRIRATKPGETRCVEVPCQVSSLDSEDCFCLTGNRRPVYIWFGQFANDEEREMAKQLSIKIAFDVPPKMFQEKFEPELFWKILGATETKDRIYQQKDLPEIKEPVILHKPRLYVYSNDENPKSIGELTTREIENFGKSDLDPTNVMVLDCYDEIFIWLGKGSNQEEKEQSLQKAYEIVRNHKLDDNTFANDINSALTFVEEGNEPSFFRANFPDWDQKENKGDLLSNLLPDNFALPPFRKPSSFSKFLIVGFTTLVLGIGSYFYFKNKNDKVVSGQNKQ
eukprot:TRINITY_DN6286_c0_g1_i1.p1 TRINITY_DN6286_c0_g1~~TRINITY_DN6286_c0_g1_i1.p1  ORF type:complete len:400 (-),score=127.00 TRINITY_DN6286_c0_g1_i1:34-1209(-)